MIIIDTNLIVHFLIDGDPTLKKLTENKEEVQIPTPIIFESVFVLQKIYKIPRESIVESINLILQESVIKAEKKLIYDIFRLYQEKTSLSIIDCFLIMYANKKRATLMSQDEKLMKVFKAKK